MRRASACRRCAANGETGRRHLDHHADHLRPPCLPPPLWALRDAVWRGPRSASLASPGGQVGPFIDLFDQVRASGERVVIDGPCLSACTLVLSIVPSDRICVTRRAVLGFHAARSVDRARTDLCRAGSFGLVLEAYPGPVRDWISRRGGLTSRLLLLRGRELTAIYPSCR